MIGENTVYLSAWNLSVHVHAVRSEERQCQPSVCHGQYTVLGKVAVRTFLP